MTAYHGEDKWSIVVTEIDNATELKGFLSSTKLYVRGRCEVYDEEGFILRFSFKYTGRPKENPSKMIEFLRAQALQILLENRRKKEENTLENFIRKVRER